MKTIVIDAGHGGYDYGAVNGNRYEKDDNLKFALALGEKLKNACQNIIYTRNTDVFIPLLTRSNISNAAKADAFVSVHRNSSTNKNATGLEVFIHPNASTKSRHIAQSTLNSMVQVNAFPSRGLSTDNFSVLRNTTAPAQLLEIGFISNNSDNESYDRNFDALVTAAANGILTGLGEPLTCNPSNPTPPTSTTSISEIQRTLNSRYAAGITADGIFGPKTEKAIVQGIQTELNRLYGANLSVDGIYGPKTKAALPILRRGTDNNLVWLLQAMLIIKGYKIAADGDYGPATESAVRSFQTAHGLSADGLAGPRTLDALIRSI